MYYLLGFNSKYSEFQKVKYLGIFNPRKNQVYKINVKDISPFVYSIVSSIIIGYHLDELKSTRESEFIKIMQCYEFVIGEVLGLNFPCFY